MNAPVKLCIHQMQDGSNHNLRTVYVIMLSVNVPGVDKPIERRIGEFDDGHQTLAQEFCKWFNSNFGPEKKP